jgi:flagellin
MSLNSVNTNTGATVALEALNVTNTQLNKVQKEVSTGYKVADATDDGAAFAVAQGLRSKVSANEAVGERLGVANGLVSVTQTAVTGISNSVADLRATVTKLADANLSSAERTSYTADYAATISDIQKYISGATYNGQNLIKAGATDVSTISDAQGGTITLKSSDLSAAVTALGTTAPAQGAAVTALASGTGAVDVFEAAVNAELGSVGANARTIQNQTTFISDLGDTLNDSIGSIVDADLAKASASLQALQIRQQLGTQSLSIANQAPSALLSLFK